MRVRSAAIPIAVVVAIGLAGFAWILLRERGDAGRPQVAAARAAKPANADELAAPATAAARSFEPERTETELPRARERAGDGSDAKSDADGVDGAVVVTDANGADHDREDGTLAIEFWREPAVGDGHPASVVMYRRDLPVVAGRFHADVPDECRLRGWRLTIGGRPALLDDHPLEVGGGRPVTIRARWIDPAQLRVVDAATHADLAEVTIVDHDWMLSWCLEHPGDASSRRVVVEHATSPFELAPAAGASGVQTRGVYWISARGHAWRRVDIDFRESAPHVVELAGAATLVVDVEGELPVRPDDEWAPVNEPRLRVRRPASNPTYDDVVRYELARFDEQPASAFPGGRKPTLDEWKETLESERGRFAEASLGIIVAEQDATIGATTFDSVTPEELSVSVEVGDEFVAPLVAGRVAVKLVAGETTRVVLTLAPVRRPEAVALSGTLFVPASWTTSGFVLDIAPVDLRGRTEKDRRHLRVDQMTQRPGPPGWYCWNAGKLLAATYTFRIEQAGFVRRFKIAAPGCEPVALVLPEAARLHVRLVDEADRKPVYVTSLAWCPAMPSWQSDASSIALSFDAESLRYSACVPIGFGYVTASDADHWLLDGDAAMAEIEAGERELVIPATRGCGVVVELLCHGERVDYPDELLGDAAIKAVGHGGGGAGTSLVDAHLEFPVTAPGRYLVTLPPIDGYAAVTPFEVEVPAGQFVQHPIEMTRNR